MMVSCFKVRDGEEPRLGGIWLLIFPLYRLNLGFEVCPHGRVMETLKSVSLHLKKEFWVRDTDLSHNEIKITLIY